MGLDYFYAIALDIDELEEERLKQSQNELEELLSDCDYSIGDLYLFIPFWYDDDFYPALDKPMRDTGKLLEKLNLINKVKQEFELNSEPIILSGYDWMVAGREQYLFGFAYLFPEEFDFSKESLQNAGLQMNALKKHQIKSSMKNDGVDIKLIGENDGFYLYKGSFRKVQQYERTGPYLIRVCITNEGITAKSFIDLYSSSLERFKSILDALNTDWEEKEIAMIFWSDMVTDCAMYWPDMLEKQGDVFLSETDEQIIEQLEKDLDVNIDDYINYHKGRITRLYFPRKLKESKIPVKIFCLDQLESLSFGSSNLEEVSLELKSLTNLKSLSLGYKLKTIPRVICELPNLEVLDLSRNKISEIPECIGSLRNLKTLALTDNQISQIPKNFKSLSNLRIINFSKNPIEDFPEVLYNLDKLKKIQLEDTNLNSLPSGIEALKNLELLSISNTNPRGKEFFLPKDIGKLPKLRTLKLNNLNLSNFPVSLTRIKSLERLDLSNNKISSLPSEIENLSKLRSLDVSNNMIEALPESLGRCQQLRSINIENNPFEVSLPKYPPAFEKLVSQMELDDIIPYKLLGVNMQDIEAVSKRMAEIIVEKHINRDGTFGSYSLRRLVSAGWRVYDISKDDYGMRRVKYHIGKLVEKITEEIKTELYGKDYEQYLCKGKRLIATSLMNSENIVDLKEAIKLFETVKSISEFYFNEDEYQEAVQKLKNLTKQNKYLLLTNESLDVTKKLVFGMYYRIPPGTRVYKERIKKKLNISEEGLSKDQLSDLNEGKIEYNPLGKADGFYFYLVRFVPAKVKRNTQGAPDLINYIISLGITQGKFMNTHEKFIEKIRDIPKIFLEEEGFENFDLVLISEGKSLGGFKWPNENKEIYFQEHFGKVNMSNLKNYRGIPLKAEQYQFIDEIETKLLGEPIPYKERFDERVLHFGYRAKRGNITDLYLSNKDLTGKLPESIGNLISLRVLKLSWNHLSEIPDSLGKLKGLKELDMYFNKGLKNLPSSLFTLENLENLDIHHNSLTSDELTNLGNLNNLKYLDMSNLPLKELPYSLKQLRKLEYLNIDRTHLSEVPEFLGKMTNLKSLVLGKNNFSMLPNSLENLDSLETLLIGDAKLEEIPNFICSLTNLRHLHIERNDIGKIPKEIENLKDLETLKIKYTKITSIPDEIGQLTNLRDLDLSENKINDLSPQIKHLKNLEQLELSFNKLTVFPDALLELKNLKFLRMGSNLIGEIPDNIDQLTSLEKFEMFDNKVKELPKSIGNMKNLEILSFEQNKLTEIPEELKNLKNLEDLNLRFMKLKNTKELRRRMWFVESLRID